MIHIDFFKYLFPFKKKIMFDTFMRSEIAFGKIFKGVIGKILWSAGACCVAVSAACMNCLIYIISRL